MSTSTLAGNDDSVGRRPSAPSSASATDSRPRGGRARGRRSRITWPTPAGPIAPMACAGADRARRRLPAPRRRATGRPRSTASGSRTTRPRSRPRSSGRARTQAGPGATPSWPATPDGSVPTIPGYTVLEELGRGGMGVVFKATAERLNRFVALKMILSGDLASPEAGARFLKEAEAVARLQHPQVVQIFRIGDYQGRPYLEMEYVDGGSLADRLDGRPWKPARRPG